VLPEVTFPPLHQPTDRGRSLLSTIVLLQLSVELDELLDWLLTDVVADDVTAAETALRQLDDKCDKLGNH